MKSEITTNGFTLSPQQKLNWLQNKVDHSCLVALPDHWTKDSFFTAVSTLFQKHEILRTRLEKVPGMEFPLQVIEDISNPSHFIDQSDRYFKNEEEIISFLKAFDITNKDVSIQFFKLEAKRYASFMLSSFIGDSYTFSYILNDIVAIYEEIETDEPLQYADLSEWLNEILAEKNEYWNSKSTPTKIQHQSAAISNSLTVLVPEGIQQELKKKNPSEMKLFLFSCWQHLIQRHYGENKSSFMASDGRSLVELKGVLGCLEKAIPWDPSKLTSTIQESILEIEKEWTERKEWEHDIPLEIEAQKTSTAFFRYIDNTISKTLRIIWQNIANENQQLIASVFNLLDDIHIQITSSLSTKRNQYLVQQFFMLLEQALISPNQRFNQLTIVSQEEKKELLMLGSGKSAPNIKEQTLHGLFEAQVLKTPEAIAIETEVISITYGDLHKKVNQIAYFLRENNETFIGLYCDRSIEMIAGMLGVLKAGKAYIPIEPSYPKGRINSILDNSQLKLILSHSTSSFSSENPSIEVKEIAAIEANVSNIISRSSLHNNAYVLYTSGSTGKPKGVSVGHHQVVNHMEWMQKEYPLTESDKILQRTPFGFDASVWEIFAPLLQGAQLTLLPEKDQQNIHEILKYIETKEITIFQVVPSLLNLLLQEASTTNFQSVNTIFCGGEILQPSLVSKLLQKGELQLVNLYGPTECTIQVSHYICSEKDKSTPIGKPIDGVRFYVLDNTKKLQPLGVKGELYIAGNCVSNGYLHQPELTKNSFIPDFITNEEGSRMYRTGDIVFWNEEGSLEIEGRIDDQIKLRGYRIELSEIEAVVMKHENISKAVALVLQEEELQRIVCFYTPKNTESINEDDILQLAKNHLADYMLPTHCIPLEKIPLTHNGKVDKKALRAIDLKKILNNREFIAPRNRIEKQLSGIWRSLLKRDKLCVTDNFFNVGGHSLLAVNLASSIQKKIGIDFPLSAVFDCPTIASQADFLSENKQETSCIVSLNKSDSSKAPVFLCSPTGGLSGSYFKLSQSIGDRAVYGLQDPGLNEKGLKYIDIIELSEIFAQEIIKIQPQGSIAIGGWSFGGIVALETARKLKQSGVTIDTLFAFDSYAPIQKKTLPSVSELYISVARLLADLSGDELTNENRIEIQESTEDTVMTILLQLAIKGKLLPKSASNKEMLRLFNVFKINVFSLNNHVCESHPFRLHLFEPKEQVPSHLREAAFERTEEKARHNWNDLGKVIVHETGGHHLNMLEEPHLEQLSNKLYKILA